jgi:hypothetical protein
VTTRLLALPLVPAVLFAGLACSGPETTPAADETPQAPPPRTKKTTTAELLVGTWKMEKSSHLKLGPGTDWRIEFTADGRYFASALEPDHGLQKKSGTYTLNGRVIRLTDGADTESPGETRDSTIEALSEDELILLAGPAHDRQRSEHRRLKPK